MGIKKRSFISLILILTLLMSSTTLTLAVESTFNEDYEDYNYNLLVDLGGTNDVDYYVYNVVNGGIFQYYVDEYYNYDGIYYYLNELLNDDNEIIYCYNELLNNENEILYSYYELHRYEPELVDVITKIWYGDLAISINQNGSFVSINTSNNALVVELHPYLLRLDFDGYISTFGLLEYPVLIDDHLLYFDSYKHIFSFDNDEYYVSIDVEANTFYMEFANYTVSFYIDDYLISIYINDEYIQISTDACLYADESMFIIPASVQFIVIELWYDFSPARRVHIFEARARPPSANPPSLRSISTSITASSWRFGPWVPVRNVTFHNPLFNVFYRVEIPANTSHYTVQVVISPMSGTPNSSTVHFLLNRTGHRFLWGSFLSRVLWQTLGYPATNWPRGQLFARPANLRTIYQNEARRIVPSFTLLATEEVHHIRPLAFGGSNAFSNLIHIPQATHRSITSWFAGY